MIGLGLRGLGIGKAVGAVSAAVTREILTWDGAATKGDLDTSITFTGDFEIELVVAIPDETITGAVVKMVGLGAANTDFVGYRNTGNVFFQVDTGFIEGAPITVDPFDGEAHTWTLTRTSTSATLKIDDVTQITSVVGTGNSSWDSIGYANSGSYLAGQILSVKYTDETPTVIQEYNIDSGSTTTENSTVSADTITFTGVVAGDWETFTYDSINQIWEGNVNLVSDSFDTVGNWDEETTDWLIAAGDADYDAGDTGNQTLINTGGVAHVVGSKYRAITTISALITGQVSEVYDGNAANETVQTTSGTYETEYIAASANTPRVLAKGTPNIPTTTLSNVSIIKIIPEVMGNTFFSIIVVRVVAELLPILGV